MILRRLTTALRKQDWATVLIEILILVLGVFLGLQVNNWNEARQLADREAEIIETLQLEFEQNIGTLYSTLSRLNERNAREYQAGQLMLAETITDNERDLIALGLKEIMYFSPLSVRDNAFESLKQSGELSLISDSETLSDLNQFSRQLAWVQGQRDSFRGGISALELDWRDYVFHQLDDPPTRTSVVLDFDGFIADRRAVSAFHQVVRMKHIFASYIPSLIKSAEQTCHMLADASGRPCEAEETRS